MEQFLRFRPDYKPQFAPAADCPVVASWYRVAEYCNWLSKEEGLPETQWCYEPSQKGEYEEGMKPASDFLKRTGYRLPTEAEWEYACRAGAATSWYFGQAEELLAKYGWYGKNSGGRTWPVGCLKPNDFGLFDVHGNVYEWCQDHYASYALEQGGRATEDVGDVSPPLNKVTRVLRGGAFLFQPENLRSANRLRDLPGLRFIFGFRPARTCN